MRDVAELKIKPFYRREPLPPPSDEDVRRFEAHFGVTLPAGYVALLRHSNGGKPAFDECRTAGGHEVGLGKFHYLAPENSARLDPARRPGAWEFGNLWAETRELRKLLDRVGVAGGGSLVSIARDDGNANVFVLDCGRDPASVRLVVVGSGCRLVDVAESFAAFVDGLSEDDS